MNIEKYPQPLAQVAFRQCCELIDEILHGYRAVINQSYQGYLNHCKRVAACCLMLSKDDSKETLRKIAIAAAFHDIGIWTAHTIDYIKPSVEEMRQYLVSNELLMWEKEITFMITEHHKVTKAECSEYHLVEKFRRADYADFTLGLVRSNIPLSEFHKLTREFPNNGFHKTLIYLGIKRLLQKPWSPLPMFKW
ncbi:MAG: HD domain-containing protein [Acinetobacter venetianus]|uniref:HD domain-containing protein n=1 Tax=Acinetobacter venetianus TaxID=52133 RepID=UPI003C73A6A2